MYTVLTIAGSDSSGGAGIEADLKTIMAYGLYGTCVITAVTAQNTLGLKGIQACSTDIVRLQLEAVLDDIKPDAVKIGMMFSEEIICTVYETLLKYKVNNIVLDPVMVSTSKTRLLEESAAEAMCKMIFPLTRLVTPNIDEASILADIPIQNYYDMEKAGKMIADKYDISVLVKGGHAKEKPIDILIDNGEKSLFESERLDARNTHGTGCTLSSAIACGLAKGNNLRDSVKSAKQFVYACMNTGLDLGKGNGPLDHCALLKKSLK